MTHISRPRISHAFLDDGRERHEYMFIPDVHSKMILQIVHFGRLEIAINNNLPFDMKPCAAEFIRDTAANIAKEGGAPFHLVQKMIADAL